jgi:hypothetical protein
VVSPAAFRASARDRKSAECGAVIRAGLHSDVGEAFTVTAMTIETPQATHAISIVRKRLIMTGFIFSGRRSPCFLLRT